MATAASTFTSVPTFTTGERVLCYHGPLVYEAKVLKAQVLDAAATTTGQVGPHYFVHYKGWKQTCVCRSSIFSYSHAPSSYLHLRHGGSPQAEGGSPYILHAPNPTAINSRIAYHTMTAMLDAQARSANRLLIPCS